MLNEGLFEILNKEFKLNKLEIGEYHKVDKKGMHFVIDSYEVEGIGHLSILEMKAMCGLMRMESIILTTYEKDAPLFNIDVIKVLNKTTLLAELYDVQVKPLRENALNKLKDIKNNNSSLPLYKTEPRWYDSIKYKESLGYSGKKLLPKYQEISTEYLNEFLQILKSCKNVDIKEKSEMVKVYVNGLLASGPTAEQFSKLIGKEKTKELFYEHIFGLR